MPSDSAQSASDSEADSTNPFDKRMSKLNNRGKMADDASTSQVPSGLQSQSDLLLLVQDMRQQLATLTGQQNRQVLAPKQVDEESEAGSESEQEEGEATSGDEQGGVEASENEDFSDESENQNIFARYHSQHKKKTDVGPDVEEKLADLVMAFLTERQDDDELEKIGSILRPQNIPMLQIQKVTERLWNDLPRSARGQDLKLQKITEQLLKMMILVTETADMLDSLRKTVERKTKKQMEPVTNKLLDSLQVRELLNLLWSSVMFQVCARPSCIRS